MSYNKKIFHIVFSYFLIFLPYLILYDILSLTAPIIKYYKFVYIFYVDKLLIKDAFGDWFIWKKDIISYLPTIIGIFYLYLSYKVICNFWENQIKQNICYLYLVNSILLSPIGVTITAIVYTLIVNLIKQ